jgi:stage III sporulation protein AG
MSLKTVITEKKKIFILVLLGALGLVLVLLGDFFPASAENEISAEKTENSFKTMEYISDIENKIRSITEKITGSTDVSVIVSAESGTEYVYVSNESAAGDKNTREYITVKNESGRYELVLAKEVYPEIKGISIACPGGDSSAVQRKIIDSVSTAFGISKNRICIVGTK